MHLFLFRFIRENDEGCDWIVKTPFSTNSHNKKYAHSLDEIIMRIFITRFHTQWQIKESTKLFYLTGFYWVVFFSVELIMLNEITVSFRSQRRSMSNRWTQVSPKDWWKPSTNHIMASHFRSSTSTRITLTPPKHRPIKNVTSHLKTQQTLKLTSLLILLATLSIS